MEVGEKGRLHAHVLAIQTGIGWSYGRFGRNEGLRAALVRAGLGEVFREERVTGRGDGVRTYLEKATVLYVGKSTTIADEADARWPVAYGLRGTRRLDAFGWLRSVKVMRHPSRKIKVYKPGETPPESTPLDLSRWEEPWSTVEVRVTAPLTR
jgi:hypothetical protein